MHSNFQLPKRASKVWKSCKTPIFAKDVWDHAEDFDVPMDPIPAPSVECDQQGAHFNFPSATVIPTSYDRNDPTNLATPYSSNRATNMEWTEVQRTHAGRALRVRSVDGLLHHVCYVLSS